VRGYLLTGLLGKAGREDRRRYYERLREESPRLWEHLNADVAKFVRDGKRRRLSGLPLTVHMMQCAMLAFERTDGEVRKFWRFYIDSLNERAAKEKAAILKRREGAG
jgi:hypothetical protein